MAILNMKRIEILAMLADSKSVVDYIQRQGTVEIDELREAEDHFDRLNTGTSVMQFEKFQGVADSAVAVLDQYAPAKSSFLDQYAPREELPVSEFLAKSQGTDETLGKCYAINSLYKDIQDCRAEITRCEVQIDQLKPWAKLDIAPSLRETANAAIYIGSFGEPLDRETILTRMAEVDPEAEGEIEVVESDKNQTCIVAICHKDNASKFEQALRLVGFVAFSETGKRTPAERIEALNQAIEDQRATIASKEEEIKTYADTRDDIDFLKDYFALRTDKYRALDKVSVDDNVFVLTGWVAEEDADVLKKNLEEKFDAAVSITDVDNSSDEVPVKIKNGNVGRTLENVTNMYSTPSHKDLDPNGIMKFFYFFLFGLMLGDAGYGLVMILVTLFVKLKYKLEPQKAKSVNYGLYCGIGTFFWGILQNSWFGDLPKWIANGLKSNEPTDFISTHHLYWFEPLANNNITRFLLLCFFFGIIHLIAGLIMNIVKHVKNGMAFEGFVDNIPPILILIGAIPVINTFIGGTALGDIPQTAPIDAFIKNASPVFYGILIAGAAGVVLGPVLAALKGRKALGGIIGGFGSGLYGLYNAASGYLGDVLSYARLLALGLCTGVIASVINQLGATPLGGNVILFIIIGLIGHTVNIGINLIGAYVHTNRLQYVEFFSKFYDGGGKAFEPLAVNTQSFKIKEEV